MILLHWTPALLHGSRNSFQNLHDPQAKRTIRAFGLTIA